MTDLAYLEPDAVCEHRISQTFQACKTSYRLLMFFNLFRRTIARGTGSDQKSLAVMCDELFDAHGAPPFGAAALLAAQVKDIQKVDDFYTFFKVMDIQNLPTRPELTKLLRDCVGASMDAGYSVWGVSQEIAKHVRFTRDSCYSQIQTFFPGKPTGNSTVQDRNSGGQSGGHGTGPERGRGRGRGEVREAVVASEVEEVVDKDEVDEDEDEANCRLYCRLQLSPRLHEGRMYEYSKA